MKLISKIALPMTVAVAVLVGMTEWVAQSSLMETGVGSAMPRAFDAGRIQVWLLLFSFSLALLAVIFSWMMRRFVIRPLEQLSIAMKSVSEGNIDTEISYEKQDEIGDLVRSFEKMRRAIRASIEETQRSRERAVQSEALAKKQVREVERLNELMISREIRIAELKKTTGNI